MSYPSSPSVDLEPESRESRMVAHEKSKFSSALRAETPLATLSARWYVGRRQIDGAAAPWQVGRALNGLATILALHQAPLILPGNRSRHVIDEG